MYEMLPRRPFPFGTCFCVDLAPSLEIAQAAERQGMRQLASQKGHSETPIINYYGASFLNGQIRSVTCRGPLWAQWFRSCCTPYPPSGDSGLSQRAISAGDWPNKVTVPKRASRACTEVAPVGPPV